MGTLWWLILTQGCKWKIRVQSGSSNIINQCDLWQVSGYQLIHEDEMASKSFVHLVTVLLLCAFARISVGEPANDKCHELTAKLELLSQSIDRLSTSIISKKTNMSFL